MVLEKIFATVLHLSFYGTIGGGVVLVCTLINYVRAPRWISMVLWGLMALRLVLPFSFSSAVSLLQIRNLSGRIEYALDFEGTYSGDYKAAVEGSALYEKAVAVGSPVEIQANGDRMAYYYQRENGRIEPAKTVYETFLPIGAHVWLVGVALLWIWAAVSYIRLEYKLRFAMRLSKGVYETDAVPSPCVVGIIKPRIYLLPDLTERQRMHILLHEQIHIRYLDHIWKMVSFLVISLHWFNPFLWLMYRLFQGELEKTCDERVLARLGEDKKADYSESLLAIATKNWNRKWKLPTPIAFGENNIKDRIKRILAYQKPLLTVSVLIIMLAVVGCGVFLTMPEGAVEDIPEEVQFSELDSRTENTLLSGINADTTDSLQGEVFEPETDNAPAETLFYADEDTVLGGKGIAELSESEQQQFGQSITQRVLQNRCKLIDISNRIKNRNMSYLDINGDGVAEEILLEPSQEPENALYMSEDDPLQYFHLRIGSADMEGFGENMSNTLWVVSLDGQDILLVLYEDGPSGDPYTHFYRYADGQIIEIGGFADDIRLCEISEEGIITGTVRKDIVQTDWITMQWRLGRSGSIEEIPQAVYDFRNGNWVELYEELPLHPAIGDAQTFSVSPQMVKFLQTSADWNWVLIETEDGRQGWMYLEDFNVVELEKNVMDVFNGLYMAG